jgi:hypothetical protein
MTKEGVMNPFIVDESRERYQNRLDEAEQWQLAKLARPYHVSLGDRLRTRIGDRLIALGQYLRPAALATPQFDEAPPA